MAVNNVTEHYRLPLPTSNEVMQYQDFINDANNLIDAALWENNQKVVAAQADATNALTQGAENNTKLAALTTQITEYDIPGIKTEQTSMNDRLEVVEDDTMSFVRPEAIPFTLGGSPNFGIIKAGGLLISGNLFVASGKQPVHIFPANTVIKPYGNFVDETTTTTETSIYELATISGNICNLPDDEWRRFARVRGAFCKADTGILHYTGVSMFCMFNGINTIIAMECADPANSFNIPNIFILPLGVY